MLTRAAVTATENFMIYKYDDRGDVVRGAETDGEGSVRQMPPKIKQVDGEGQRCTRISSQLNSFKEGARWNRSVLKGNGEWDAGGLNHAGVSCAQQQAKREFQRFYYLSLRNKGNYVC